MLDAHSMFALAGTLVALVVFRREAVRRGVAHDERLVWIVLAALLAGAIGAKLGTAWRYVAVTGDLTPAGILLRAGRSIIGGLAGAYAGVVVMRRLVRYPRRTGDLFAPAVALGLCIGRIGCLLTEPPGTPTALPWGIRISAERAAAIPGCPEYCAAGIPLHPSFAYESLFHLAAFLSMPRLAGHARAEGDIFRMYLLGYAVFRFLIEFVRGNPVLWFGLTGSQLFLLPVTGVLMLYFGRHYGWRHARHAAAGAA